MKQFRRLTALLLVLYLSAFLPACGEKPAENLPPVVQNPVIPPDPPAPQDPAESLLSQMSLRQKVGQLFIVRPEILTTVSGRAEEFTEEMRTFLEEYPVGGIIQFGENIKTPEQILAFNNALQAASQIPLFLAVDEEGGPVARLANNKNFDLPKYKNAASVGADGNSANALQMGQTIGEYLKEYGFNLDFAPVADVNTNPSNPVIGNRAFSSDPAVAAQMARAMADGLNNQGIIGTFKHFPGHGDTGQDSHYGLALSHKTLDELQACELIPFRMAGEKDMVMVGHISLPEVTGSDIPATFSREIITGILKENLGFQGLIITDSLEMGAVTKGYSSGEATLLALKAGCHLIPMPEDFREAFDGVISALNDGTLTEEWLNETVLKVLNFKILNGVIKG